MKRYEVWLNGRLKQDYVKRGDAENKCFKLISRHHLNDNDDVLYIRDSETDEYTNILG